MPHKTSLQTLESLARRGKLPGYRALSDSSFRVDAFGNPFDADLIATITSTDPLELRFTLRVRRTFPLVFALVTLLTIWPGVLITDSLIPGEWGWWPTEYWYLPLTILPIPLIVRSLRKKTRVSTRAHAQKQIRTICQALSATAVGPAIDAQAESAST